MANETFKIIMTYMQLLELSLTIPSIYTDLIFNKRIVSGKNSQP